MHSRNVKGVLFADYVRMLRSQKDLDLSGELTRQDLFYLRTTIDPDEWYPMETFERLGLAILNTIAGGDLEAVRLWGKMSVDLLRASTPALVAEGDPVDTMMRFRVQRSTWFDFEALAIPTLVSDHASVVVHYFMAAKAEEAAAYQTMGFFERLLEIAGASNVRAAFSERAWAGDGRTRLDLEWTTD